MKIKTIASLVACSFVSIVGCSSIEDDKVDPVIDAGSDSSSDPADVVSAIECSTASGCTAPAGPCAVCDSGDPVACPTTDCVEGKCVVTLPTCDSSDGGLVAPEASPDPTLDAEAE